MAALLGNLKQVVKQQIKRLAPLGSRRRYLIQRIRWFYHHGFSWIRQELRRIRHGGNPFQLFQELRYGRLPATIADVYDLDMINCFLRNCGREPLRKDGYDPANSELEAQRWILVTLTQRADLRERFPTPLRDGLEGGFCQTLCTELGKNTQAIANVKAVFARKPAARPRQIYDEYYDWKDVFPLGLTPAGSAGYLRHLLADASGRVLVAVEDILWSHLQNAEDPYKGVIDSYLLHPIWQEKFPDGITHYGWAEFRAWLKENFWIKEPWIDELPEPNWIEEEAAKRLHKIAHPEKEVSIDRTVLGANVIAHFRYPSGLQEASMNTVRGLEKGGIRCSPRDLPAGIHFDWPDRTGYLGLEPYDVTLLHMAPEPLVDVCYPLSGLWKRPGTYRIAVWYWELESVPTEWTRHANLLSEIWAPTKFIHEAMSKVMPVPVVHMLPGILPPQAPDLPRSHFQLDESKYLFLFMFDMNSVLERKNAIGTIQAFHKAFAGKNDVQLIVKVSRGNAEPANFARLKQAIAEAGSNVLLIDQVMSRDDSYSLMKCCDCYVSLHRSEGYGLTMAEAMFFRKPVIATAYSGNLDFMTPETSLLIPYKRIPLDRDYGVYRKGCHWADPNLDDAADAMRWAFDHPSASQEMGNRAFIHISDVLSLEAYGKRLRKRLEELAR